MKTLIGIGNYLALGFGFLTLAAVLWSAWKHGWRFLRFYYRALTGELDGPLMTWRDFHQVLAIGLLTFVCWKCAYAP